MVDVPLAPLHALQYARLFDSFLSDELNYDSVFNVKEKSVAVVEFRHNLTTARQGVFDALSHNGNPEFVMERCCEYITAVEYLKTNEERLQDRGRALKCRSTWTSAMGPGGMFGRPQRFTINTFSEEVALVLMRWVAAAWQRAQAMMLSIASKETSEAASGSAGAAPDSHAITQCLEAFRRAAGAAQHIADVLLPKLSEGLDGKLPDVPEMQPWFARCLAKTLLATAQHLFAHHAERKGSPGSLAAALFIGASDMFEEASGSIKKADDEGLKVPPEEFKRYIALYSTLSLARARFCMVRVELDARESGKASVAAKHAENELAQCAYVAEGNQQWTDAFTALQGDAEKLWNHCERMRRNVYSQSLSKDPPDKLPAGRVAATAIEFVMPEQDYMLDFESV